MALFLSMVKGKAYMDKNIHIPVRLMSSIHPFGVQGTKHVSRLPLAKRPALMSLILK